MSIHNIPFGKYLATEAGLAKLSPEERNKRFEAYRNSIGFGNGIKSTTVLDDYISAHIDKLEKFTEIKMPDGISLTDKVQALAPNNPANALFAKALKLTDDTSQAIDNFKADMASLNALVNTDPPLYSISAIAGQLIELKADAKRALDAQHAEEKNQLLKLFEDPSAERDTLIQHLGLDAAKPGEITKLRDDMAESLQKKQSEELEKLSKTLEDEANDLHRVAQNERDRIAFLAQQWEDDEEMKKAINELAEKRRQELQLPNDDDTAISWHMNEDGDALFKGIDPRDLVLMKTITGRSIQYDKATDSFKMALPRFGLWYYNTADQKIDYDFTSMATAVRACRYKNINLSVTYHDKEYAMELARRMYRAAARADFDPNEERDPNDPEKIIKPSQIKSIKVNNEVISVQDLFKDDPQRLATINNEYQKNKEKREAPLKTSKKEANDLKNYLHEKRAEQAQQKRQAQQAQNAAADPNAPPPPPELAF